MLLTSGSFCTKLDDPDIVFVSKTADGVISSCCAVAAKIREVMLGDIEAIVGSAVVGIYKILFVERPQEIILFYSPILPTLLLLSHCRICVTLEGGVTDFRWPRFCLKSFAKTLEFPCS